MVFLTGFERVKAIDAACFIEHQIGDSQQDFSQILATEDPIRGEERQGGPQEQHGGTGGDAQRAA